MDGKTIGHKLRALRGEMDAKTVADALGISTSALFMYERGERIPRDQIKKRIAQYFDQSVEEIFSQNEHILCASSSKGGEEDEEQHPERNPRAPRTRRALKENRPQAVRAAQERKCQFFGRRANH